jgi:hypothetical protein
MNFLEAAEESAGYLRTVCIPVEIEYEVEE